MKIDSDLEKLNPITVRVPKKLRDDLLKLSSKNRRSLSSYCRIILEDNFRGFGGNTRYDKLKYPDENFVPLSFTITEGLKTEINNHIKSFKRKYYWEITFSVFVRKVLSDSKKE